MFGDAATRNSDPQRPAPRTAWGDVAVTLDGVATAPAPGAVPLRDVSLRLRGGEILGVAGVSGNGQRELADAVLGFNRLRAGGRTLWGEDATHWSAARIRERGVASIPDDPVAFALIPALTVRENLGLGAGRRYRSALSLNWPRLIADMETSAARLRFPPLSFDVRAGALSGGNQQRVALTREFARDPKLIVALYPSRGLDARSAESMRALFEERRAAGGALMLISEDLEELFSLSDRIIVLSEGRVAKTFAPNSFDPDIIGPYMVGAADAA
jgi:simple sugar transport system ATP-binding protein